MARISQSIAMGVGAAGAMVDVSTDANLLEGMSHNYGRTTEWEQIPPGQFSFVLDNPTGKYTPDNPSSTLATKVTEGMQVCWQLGTRLRSGTVRSIAPVFPEAVSAWAQVRISCDDMLGDAGRHTLTGLAESMVVGAPPYLYWPMDDATGSLTLVEQSGNLQPPLTYSAGLPTTNVAGPPALDGQSQSQLTGQYSYRAGLTPFGAPSTFTTIAYPSGVMGSWGAWFTPVAATSSGNVVLQLAGFLGSISFGILAATGLFTLSMGSATQRVIAAAPVPAAGVAHYVSITLTYVGSTSITGELFVDGVSQGTADWLSTFGADPAGLGTNLLRTPRSVSIVKDVTVGDMNVAHLSHTPARVSEELALPVLLAARLGAVDKTAPEVTLSTLPSDLAAVTVGQQSGSSTLDAFNALMFAEQGQLYAATTGTLLAPVQTIAVRARQRPSTVSYSFDADRELSGAAEFLRDPTNMRATVVADGVGRSVSYRDATLIPRAGSASITESVLNTDYLDLLMWAQDRLVRGANINLRVASVTINAFTTPTDRSVDLLAMVPGDRIQITNLPTAQLGFTTWDGWFLGATETHTATEHTFVLYFQPVLPATAVYDTNQFMSGGIHTLSSSITSGATTMSVATSDPVTLLETVTFPYTFLIDSEQVTVTACTSATPQVATITRAVNGTTAAAHTSGAAVELATASLYAF